ncbi:lipopolysaccharide biosynthesis protein RfbH [Microbacter margulisiae]|uniref:CDP-6-deoxy-D-xylo-4-hexulose-3-dehydrase n=1 Tax=Microbacter margulisiae TaxID=1350067 RepID=A0A7W5DS28_9PORP|nr:lipopolysaccharide biosynthesis protein RfbH [Microbacter margulisiae]MBB3187213.1 CDP-6-deoxy-D-xylo-4-hexulose-3-dehydrase [Microbacter margulisiae]
MNYKGKIFKVPFPYTDLSSSKKRPVLALSEPNEYGDIRFAFITTKNYPSRNQIILKQTDFKSIPLPVASYLQLDKIVLLSKDIILKELAELNASAMFKLLRRIVINETEIYHHTRFQPMEFIPGKSKVNYAGRVFDEQEVTNAVDASLDFWLTEGRFSEAFAEKIAEFLGVEHVLLTNSGSSANLLAFSALTSEKLGDRRLKPGDEVISVAAGFPATITPIIQNGLIPVFVDVDIPTYNIDVKMIEKAISPKTRCIFLAHTLGNPFHLDVIMDLAEKYHLWVIEDNCDAFGSRYKGKYTGTFGHISTISFYPAHHITTGEGGAICTNDPQLARLIRAFRDWGRDCYCTGGENNTCGKRFTQQFGKLPVGYDHKYVYSEIGYNLKMTDIQAAIGSAQMDKLPAFCESRKANFHEWTRIFTKYSDYFLLPEATENADPAWFAFIVTLKDNVPFTRDELTRYLNSNLIETRNLFAGNITKQPGYVNKNWRIADHLDKTDYIMNNTFFLGTYPGLTKEMFDYAEEILESFLKGYAE